MKKARTPIYGQVSTLPNAWIVTNNRKGNLSNDRGRKKIYPNNKIYLEDGQEFELELMNPLMNSVLAVITINGQRISNNGLVLRPGERVYLDCFLETRKKFTFNTYQTEDSQEAQAAIQNNGYVQIAFHSEVAQITNFNNGGGLFGSVYTATTNGNMWSTGISNVSGSNTTTITPSPFFNNNTGTYHLYNGSGITNTIGSGIVNTSYTSNLSNLTSDSNQNNALFSQSISSTSPKVEKSISPSKLNDKLETGRVEAGAASNQTFENVNMDFQSWAITTVTYQILPEKIKPVTIEDFKPKNYCPGCGRKLAGNENFCPSCGSKLS